MENYKLLNGVEIPKVGFGCYKLDTDRINSIITDAIECGYRHFDTAKIYGNEKEVGRALKNCGIDRKELFVTTKLWNDDLTDPEKAFEESMKLLDLDYIDLYLIHWPRPDLDCDWKAIDIKAWKYMEERYKTGDIRAIGVSNFLPHHLDNIMDNCEIKPMVNQLEYHPGYTQEAAVRYSKDNDILVEAWSPLGRARLGNDSYLSAMAEKYHMSLQKLCLRFELQNGLLPIPKASSKERMMQNIDVFDFEISKEDMSIINTMPQVGWSGEHPDRERVPV